MKQDRARLSERLRETAYLLTVQSPPRSIARELDDENPVIPLGIDIDHDVATAALLGWSEQDSGYEPSLWIASVEQQEGDWVPYGLAGGLPPSNYPLADRRACSAEGLHLRLYMGPENAVVTAFGNGSPLDTLDLRRGAHDLYRELRRRDPDGWPFGGGSALSRA